MKFSAVLLAISILGLSSVSCAQSSFGLGLRVGTEMEVRLPDGPGKLDSDKALGGYVNYFWHEKLGLELGYTNLGSSSRSGILDAGFELDGNLYTFGLVGSVPIADQWRLLGGVGGFNLREDGTSITIAGARPFDNDDSGFYLDAGARFDFNPNIAARLSYQWFDFDQGGDGTPWLGAEVRF